MDGNGRWANSKFLPRSAGHASGVSAAKEVIKSAIKYNINTLTLFAFSSENWTRPQDEITSLFSLFIKSINEEKDKLKSSNINITFIGERTSLPNSLQKIMREIEVQSKNNNGLHLNIAISYGGRSEIIRATNKFIKKSPLKKLISEALLSKNLDTYGMPDIDLLIRTGGEKRLSNFLLWQLAYSELYFTNELWPDFKESDFIDALYFFQCRNRRFGSLSDHSNA